MINASEDRFITCPYCGEEMSLQIDYSGGLDQSFTIDCEVCCRPIAINLELTLEGVQRIDVTRES